MAATNTMKVLREEFQNVLVELRNGEFPLFDVIAKRDNYQDNIKWTVNTSTGASTGIAATSAAPAASSDVVQTATLPNGAHLFSETIELTKNDMAAHAEVGANDALRDLFRAHLRTKVQKMLTSIESNLFAGVGNQASGGMVGLDAICADAAYAGIDPSTYTAWSAYLNTSGSNRALTEALLRTVHTNIRKKGKFYDAIVMPYELFEKFEALVDAKEGVYTGNSLIAQLGYAEGMYKGRPIICSPQAPDNQIYFVNTKDMALFTRRTKDTQVVEGLNVQLGQIDAGTSRNVKFEIAVFPQLVYADRASVGLLEALIQ